LASAIDSASQTWDREIVKTTLEIPDLVFRRAKARAAELGIPLRQFVTEAVEEKLRGASTAEPKPWMKAAGALRHLRHETARINKLIEEEFEKIEQ
jgi:hypothetical protein